MYDNASDQFQAKIKSPTVEQNNLIVSTSNKSFDYVSDTIDSLESGLNTNNLDDNLKETTNNNIIEDDYEDTTLIVTRVIPIDYPRKLGSI